MGAYNPVRTKLTCPGCHEPAEVDVQFKYGETWLHSYKIGDALRWGGLQVGVPGASAVVVSGWTGARCESCGRDNAWDLYVHVLNDAIRDVTVADGSRDFVKAGSEFIVLER